MRTIYKYPLEVKDGQTIYIKGLVERNALVRSCEQVVHVGVQGRTPCIWCLVDDERKERPVRVVIHGTGHNADETVGKMKCVGSFTLLDGKFVGHVFLP